MSSTEKKALEILQENITFLQKELPSKDEIIKTLIETQHLFLNQYHIKNQKMNQIESAHPSPNKMNSSKVPLSPHL